MLQGMQPQRRQNRCILASEDAEDAALVSHPVFASGAIFEAGTKIIIVQSRFVKDIRTGQMLASGQNY